ncbi:hypothetical protein VH571_15615 [Frondihabitans sp. 4ASC-45]|uniref:hypothetical protein n=1 Tax=Frondihabitans sp. 4ASC-45 TaxID=3111636 RepID=UPI003C230BBD
MTETLEVTTLRLSTGLSTADFVAANADIDEYLKRQPGFEWRRIMESADGTIIDIVAYDSMEHARSGAAGISDEMAASPVHASIDHSTVDWKLTTLAHGIDAS